MTLNIRQLAGQRDILRRIAVDISNVEQIAFSAMTPENKQQAMAEVLRTMRQTVTGGLADESITSSIIEGYRVECVQSLFVIQEMVTAIFSGMLPLNDRQLRVLVMAFERYNMLADEYFRNKSAAVKEVGNGN